MKESVRSRNMDLHTITNVDACLRKAGGLLVAEMDRRQR
jgi:hypothetical protein